MPFLKRRTKLFRELEDLKKAEINASQKVQKASERLDVVISENGFHLVLQKAITGGKHAG